MNLIDLTVRGSLVFLLAFVLEQWCGRRMNASSRRAWWILAALAFLLPVHFPVWPASALPHLPDFSRVSSFVISDEMPVATTAPAHVWRKASRLPWQWGWLGGAAIYLLLVAIQTMRVSRRWARERLSTDPELLSLLEDCKQEAGITAPIGLVVSSEISLPAILGWLRPRILLPAKIATELSREELRAVFLHELAHFRAMDIPVNWLFTLARALHWFNPLVHLACRAWTRFREEAADESAMCWLRDQQGAYGETLLHALKNSQGQPAPFGALAIGESLQFLKKRLTMINLYHTKSSRLFLAGSLTVLLAALVVIQPTRAENPSADDPEKKEAVAAMEGWLKKADGGEFSESWKEASSRFKQAVSEEKWVGAMNNIRIPLGKCLERKLASALHQTKALKSGKELVPANLVSAQYETSFENQKYALETVTFEKEADGVWRASGYFIKPRP